MDFDTLRAMALELGFGDAGICSARGYEKEEAAVKSGPPLAERKQLRFYPESDDAHTRSLAVLLWPYAPCAVEGGEKLFLDSYYRASNAAYHAARKLESQLTEHGVFAKANVSYPAREAAVRAGLGIVGDSGMLITKKYGTRVVIILMATDIPCDKPDARQLGECMHCGRCERACPGGALCGGRMAHPENCMRNYMMEGIVAPEDYRKKMGTRLLGCDICQRVCPMQPDWGEVPSEAPEIDALLTADDRAFSAAVAGLAAVIGKNAARPQRVRAQAAIIAGNLKREKDLPVLRAWAQSPFPAVGEHAKWAIAQIEAAKATGLDQSREKR